MMDQSGEARDIVVTAMPGTPFVFKWPEGEEQFERVWDLDGVWRSRHYRIRHGLSHRPVYGRNRVHSVTWVEDQPMVEGVEADDYATSRALLSVLRVAGKKLVRTLDEPPDGYESFTWVDHRREIAAKYSKECLALKIVEDDLETWALHVLLRMASKAAVPPPVPKPVAAELVAPPRAAARPDPAGIARKLLDVGRELAAHPVSFSGKADADALIREDPFAFLLAVVFDQGIPAERAWLAPHLLKERLGHLDPRRLRSEGERLGEAIRRPPSLHRFVKTLPGWIVAAAEQVLSEYDGDAGAIWGDQPRAKDVQRRLEAFVGIGQKKAAMAVEILERDLHVPIKRLEGSDIAFDVHLRRVFLRTGLAERDDVNHMVEVARALYPPRPGELDYPTWHVGRTWCHPENPDCDHCALGEVCPRFIDRASGVTGV
jgi:uncharacterized HhH-GPD family protein